MKKEEVEQVLECLTNIKQVTDKQEFLVTSKVNQEMNVIRPILNKELERMSEEQVECNSPKIDICLLPGINQAQEYLNSNLEKLILNDFKIIDYTINVHTIKDKEQYMAIIKYTR